MTWRDEPMPSFLTRMLSFWEKRREGQTDPQQIHECDHEIWLLSKAQDYYVRPR